MATYRVTFAVRITEIGGRLAVPSQETTDRYISVEVTAPNQGSAVRFVEEKLDHLVNGDAL